MEKENLSRLAAAVSVEEDTLGIAKGIIKNSIRSAICIDDIYAAPYSDDIEGLNFEDPKKLFYSFRKDGHCDLDIYQYTNEDEWNKHRYLLHNKDLLIQDWELNNEPGPGKTKYDSTLPILNDVFQSNIIPFVVIYTNREDLSEVSQELLSNFNIYNNSHFDLITSELQEKFKTTSENWEDIPAYLEKRGQIQSFHEYIRFPKKRQDIQDLITKSLGIFLEIKDPDNKIVKRKIKSVLKDWNGIESLDDAILFLCNVCLSKDRPEKASVFSNTRINIERLCYSINGTIVLLLHKGDLEDGVKPEDLFEVFSQSITNNPHSIINLISTELKDKFREDFSKIGTNFNTIDESAFLYHAKNYYQKNEPSEDLVFQELPFKNFVVRSWIHELLQKNLDLNLESFKLIEQEVQKHSFKEGSDLEFSLAKYASMVSCVKLANRTNYKLGFGDIFRSGEHYFLCITPHCDCFNPTKINNEFNFIKNDHSKPKLGAALKKAEQGFYSFIMNVNKPDVINWACKPFTSHLPKEMNGSKRKSITYSGVSYDLEYVCSLKENYAQRISNNSFGQGYRVGIDLPHLSQ